MSNRFSRVPRSARYLSAGLLWLPLAHAVAQEWDCRQSADGWQCRPGSAGAVAAPATSPPAAAPARAPATATATPSPPALAAPPVERRPLAAAVTAAGHNDWDWVPADQLSAEQRASSCCTVARGCGGAYVEPARDWLDAERSPEGSAVRTSSGSSEWQGDQVALQDQVIMTQGNMRLSASDGEFDRKQNLARLRGGVIMRQPGLKLIGDSAEVDIGSGLGDVNDARFLDYRSGARGTASRLSRTSEEVIELEQASYTQCPPDNEDWRLTASHIRLDRESGRGTSKHTVVRVGDVPVFYSPYLNFPIDDRRQTGFLWPGIGTSGDGLDIALPYYINLAPNYDATLTPRHITDRGTMLEAELRYMDQYSRWELAGANLAKDKANDDEERWLVSLDQRGRYGTHWSSYVDYNKVSDNDYFDDFSITSLNIRRETHLTQRADLGYNYGRWSAGLALVQYQTLDDLIAEPYRKLPQLTLRRTAPNTNFDLGYDFFAEATAFDNRDSIDNGGRFVTGTRYYAEPGIVFPMRWAAGYIAPEVRMRYVGYDLDEVLPGADENPSATTPLGIVDTGLFFERDTSWGGEAFRQTLEPRLYYLYSEYKDQSDQPNFDTNQLTFTYQQLFQPRRFAGRDRLEDFNQLTVGLTTRYIENSSGRELLSASLGQIQYFEDRRVTLNQRDAADSSSSNIAAQLNFSPSDPVWASLNALWDPDQNKMQQGSMLFHWESGQVLYNIGYRYYRASSEVSTLTDGIDQVDFSAVWPVSERWRLFARWNYDIDDNRSLEDMFGVEYEDCCWLLRVVYQNAVEAEELDALGIARADREEALLVEFQLKGLGSLGRKASKLLEESIWGYRERD